MTAPDRKKLIIVGAGEFGEIACEYFTHDSDYRVVAFSVERQYLASTELMGLPVLPFEELAGRLDPAEHHAFVALTYTGLNRPRARLYRRVKEMGFRPATYVSSRAFVWRDVEIGENCFIFENNVLQYKVRVGNNVVLWSGNHIGHRTVIRDHCFISSHVVVSGYCEIGEACFLGVNTSLNDHTTLAKDGVFGNGAIVTRNTEPGRVYVGNPARASGQSSYDVFKVGPEPA